MSFTTEISKVEARVGMQSCVGVITVGRPYPLSFGNYFGLSNGLRVFNFWSENLEMARARFLEDGLVQIKTWTWSDPKYGELKAALIWDERIPLDWYHNKMCFTGFGRPTAEVAADMYALVGDPGNEMEYWSDAEMYYARRGQKYVAGSSCVSWSSGMTAEQLVADLLKARGQQ